MSIELHHPVTFRVVDVVGKNTGPVDALHGALQQFVEMMAVIDVVAQHQGARIVTDEILANDECLCQTIRRRLHRIGNVQAPTGAIP
ncbi:hypothetical protein D3C80_1840030 [compost metagenome]